MAFRPRHKGLEEHIAQMDALPMTARCMFCTWEWQGTAAEGRTEALTHRLRAHPDVKPLRRKMTRNLKSFNQANLKKEDWDDVMAERAKRARLVGLTLAD